MSGCDLHLSRTGAVTLWLAMCTVHSYNQRFSISTGRRVVASESGFDLHLSVLRRVEAGVPALPVWWLYT